jgi:hypothetical protein
MAFFDFLKDIGSRFANASGELSSFDKFGPNYKEIVENQLADLDFKEKERAQSEALMPLRVQQAEQNLANSKQFAAQSQESFEHKKRMNELEDMAYKDWGESSHGVPPGEDGPTMDADTARTVFQAAELRRKHEKGEIGAEAAGLQLRVLQDNIADEEEKEETIDDVYPLSEQLEHQREGALLSNRERKARLDKTGAPMSLTQQQKATNQFIEAATGINMGLLGDVGEKESLQGQFNLQYEQNIGALPEELDALRADNQAGDAAVAPAVMHHIMTQVASRGGSAWTLSGTDARNDQLIAGGILAAMSSGVPAQQWDPKIKQAWLQLKSLAQTNPQYASQITGGLMNNFQAAGVQ